MKRPPKLQPPSSRRNPLNWAPCQLIYLCYGRQVVATPDELEPYFAGKLWDLTTFAPLHKRGRAIQERILSPRTLRLGAFLAWECRQSLTIDAFPNDLPRLSGTFTSPKNNLMTLTSPETLRGTWRKILCAYTLTDTTQKDDKLEALLGIIKKIERITGNKNLLVPVGLIHDSRALVEAAMPRSGVSHTPSPCHYPRAFVVLGRHRRSSRNIL